MKHINVALFAPHAGCPHQCSFCDQRTISGQATPLTPAAVHEAVRTALASLPADAAANGEIAFFGGSFTLLPQAEQIALLEAAHSYIKDGRFRGIRISTRPDGIDPAVCALLRRYGVTAVELGAQSMDDRVLALNRRGHTADRTVQAHALLRASGFETGLQMMTGLYGSTDADSLATAEAICALQPDTVRIYPTVVLAGTPLAALMEAGQFQPQGLADAVALCAKLLQMFDAADIRVIRVGLHASRDVEARMRGGAYHPALRELAESRILLERAREQLAGLPAGRYTLAVAPASLSKMTGQRRCNLQALAAEGYRCTVEARDGLGSYDVLLAQNQILDIRC
ncbi:MAG: radical SAM protein [Clostridia bacterium]|nr:radical SAM protein [Clostridia bacterium]